MGKYTRKGKMNGDVSLTDVSQSFLGVRTRAKTLELQRRQSAAADYLELRSRRLEKPPLVKNSPKSPPRKQGCNCGERENNPEEIEKAGSGSGLHALKNEIVDSEIEGSFGENNLDSEVSGRSTRESTPCSFIRATDITTPPGSSSKQRTPPADTIQCTQNTLFTNLPTMNDIEEFFAHAEQTQQHLFLEKYNFDVVNDVPLPGRYEWVKVMP